MILVVVRCGAAGCGKTLATLEAAGFSPDEGFVGMLVTADVRREALVRADFSGEVEVPMCRRHFQRTDLENDVTYRGISLNGSPAATKRTQWQATFPIAAELFREPVEKAFRTRKTQSLVIR